MINVKSTKNPLLNPKKLIYSQSNSYIISRQFDIQTNRNNQRIEQPNFPKTTNLNYTGEPTQFYQAT